MPRSEPQFGDDAVWCSTLAEETVRFGSCQIAAPGDGRTPHLRPPLDVRNPECGGGPGHFQDRIHPAETAAGIVGDDDYPTRLAR